MKLEDETEHGKAGSGPLALSDVSASFAMVEVKETTVVFMEPR